MYEKRDKFALKKVCRILGNLLTIIAIVFVVKRFWNMGIDFKVLTSPKTMIALALAVVVQTFTLCVGCFPWLRFVEAFSDKKIPFSSAMPVYTKANIYKYIPGNIFQYVERNKLAIDMEISHVDVACSTILDIICGIIPLCMISVIMLGGTVYTFIRDYWENVKIIIVVGFIFLALFIFAILIFRKKLTTYFSRYKRIFYTNNRKKLIPVVVYYIIMPLLSVFTYFIVVCLLFDQATSLGQRITIAGAYVFAWILGYITLGAPSGIGIRESVMIIVCGGMFEKDVIVYVLLFRISSIISDILSFIIGTIFEKGKQADQNKV